MRMCTLLLQALSNTAEWCSATHIYSHSRNVVCSSYVQISHMSRSSLLLKDLESHNHSKSSSHTYLERFSFKRSVLAPSVGLCSHSKASIRSSSTPPCATVHFSRRRYAQIVYAFCLFPCETTFLCNFVRSFTSTPIYLEMLTFMVHS